MINFRTLIYFVLIVAVISIYPSQKLIANDRNSENELSNFPTHQDGLVRHVIFLPKKKNESDLKVEIIPGKLMSVDCNNHRLMGSLSEENLKGWGYTYYVFKSNGQTASTMMMCNEPKTDKFVVGNTIIADYNSKLPLVIYAPNGFDVKYRVWKAGKMSNSDIK